MLASNGAGGEIRIGAGAVPCSVGGADTACALAGLGLRTGEGFVAVGSGAQVVRVMDYAHLDATLRTHTFATAGDAGAGWYRIGAVQSSGLALTPALAWLGASIEEASAALAEGMRPDDPLFVPYLSGERTPFMDPGLRGSWHGLTLATGRTRRVLELTPALQRAIFCHELVQATHGEAAEIQARLTERLRRGRQECPPHDSKRLTQHAAVDDVLSDFERHEVHDDAEAAVGRGGAKTRAEMNAEYPAKKVEKIEPAPAEAKDESPTGRIKNTIRLLCEKTGDRESEMSVRVKEFIKSEYGIAKKSEYDAIDHAKVNDMLQGIWLALGPKKDDSVREPGSEE